MEDKLDVVNNENDIKDETKDMLTNNKGDGKDE